MPNKYDWEALKAEFLKGNYVSVADFCKVKGLPDPQKNSYTARNVAGWSKIKVEVAEKALEKYSAEVSEDMFQDTKAIRLMQAEAAKKVATRALEYLLDSANEIKNMEDARKLLETAYKILNMALGISEKAGKDSKLTQVNIYGSKFGQLVEDLDEEGLSRVLAELRDVRRNRPPSLGESVEREARREVVGEIK